MDILVDHVVVEGVFDVAAFFFGVDEGGLGKLLEMMADGGLGQIDIIVQIYAIKAFRFLFDLVENLQPGRVGKGFRDLFGPFCIH